MDTQIHTQYDIRFLGEQDGHPDPVAAPVAAAKLFTVGSGLSFAPLASPPMNNFG